jgi:hypothetical protein
MSKRQQQRALIDLALTLRQIADDIEAIDAPDRIASVAALIEAGGTLFAAAAEALRSGKPTPEELAAADALTVAARRVMQ